MDLLDLLSLSSGSAPDMGSVPTADQWGQMNFSGFPGAGVNPSDLPLADTGSGIISALSQYAPAMNSTLADSAANSAGYGLSSAGGGLNAGLAVDSFHPTGEPDLISRLKQYATDISQYGKDNKDNPLLKMALDGVGGASKNAFEKEKMALAQQYKLDQMNQEAQIAKDKIDATSASVRSTKPFKGIIGSALTRFGGTPVFSPSGTVLR